MNMCVLSLWKGAFCVIFALDRGWVKTCFRKDDGMRHRKKLALFLALCVGAGSLVITTGEEKPVRAAEAAVEELERSDYEKLYAEEMKKSGMIHGEYNYHNIIMTKEGIATTNFEKFRRDIQVEDLYYFLRKVLEKSGWKIRLGDGMLNAYSAIHPLTEGEMEYLKIRLIYPEKFWKIANFYYNSGKAWIPMKNMEKLYRLLDLEEEKKTFLEHYRGVYL